ncbi:MAG: RidA family protein [Actinomycetota bacterium]
MSRIEDALARLGIELPPAPAPLAAYVPVRVAGDLAFVAGQVPSADGRPTVAGRVGADVTVEAAALGCRRAALQSIAALRAALGDLDRVAGIAQVTVFVASAPGFTEQPRVANGASELLVELLGDDGRHARAAVGVSELPLGAAVEVAVTAILAR